LPIWPVHLVRRDTEVVVGEGRKALRGRPMPEAAVGAVAETLEEQG
jgi:hypothetical protein